MTYTIDSLTGTGPAYRKTMDSKSNWLQTRSYADCHSARLCISFTANVHAEAPWTVRCIHLVVNNDPQFPKLKITLVAEGIQGLAQINPSDTLDFATCR